jgi:hypothetical protein
VAAAAPLPVATAAAAAAAANEKLTGAYFDDRPHPATMPEQAELREDAETPPAIATSGAAQSNGGFSSMHYSLRYGVLQSP